MSDESKGLALLRTAAHKVCGVLLEHLMLSVLASITAAAAVVAVLCKDWLLASHTLTLPVGLWVAFLAMYPLLFVGGILLDTYWPARYTDEGDIKNRLSIYFRRVDPGPFHDAEFTLHYRWLDKKYRLKRGSAKKYLAQVAKECGWNVVEGAKTVRVWCPPITHV